MNSKTFTSEIDPFTNRPEYVIAYTVEEGGPFRSIMCSGRPELEYEFNTLYARQDVMTLRVYGLNNLYHREIVKKWVQDV